MAAVGGWGSGQGPRRWRSPQKMDGRPSPPSADPGRHGCDCEMVRRRSSEADQRRGSFRDLRIRPPAERTRPPVVISDDWKMKLRELPSVDEVVERLRTMEAPRGLIVGETRRVLGEMRAAIRENREPGDADAQV